MIPSIYKDALHSIRTAEQKIGLKDATALEEAYEMTVILRDLLGKIKEHVIAMGFEDADEEIEFFKNVKPQILGKLIYYNKVFRIESSRPIGSGKLYLEHFSDELRSLEQDYKEQMSNSEFYRYYRQGRTDYDHAFFQLGKIDLHDGVSSFSFEIDAQFSTLYDYKIAKIISNELLYKYLLSKTENGQHEYGESPYGLEKEFFWTDSKNALIELIYALHASGSISHGKLGIRKISAVFQLLFRVQLGDVHHAFHRMKDRTERSLFLDQLTSSLRQHMEKEL